MSFFDRLTGVYSRYHTPLAIGFISGIIIALVVIISITSETLKQSQRNSDDLERLIKCVSRISIAKQKVGTIRIKNIDNCTLRRSAPYLSLDGQEKTDSSEIPNNRNPSPDDKAQTNSCSSPDENNSLHLDSEGLAPRTNIIKGVQ